MESKGNNAVTVCKKCTEYEIQLKEALEEISSIQMINELLQKELLAHAKTKSTWRRKPDPKGHDRQPFKTGPLDQPPS